MANGIGGSGGGSAGAVRAGAAFVELTTNDSKLHAGLNKARGKVEAWSSKVAKVSLAAAGAALAGIAGLGRVFVAAISRGTELGRLADKLGIGADKLSAFAYVAETTGITFEELEGHFENFAERVAQAANGAGEGLETFRKLGLNAFDLKGMDQVDQLLAVADAMRSINNQTERLGMLSSLGGDQFQKMNRLFKLDPSEAQRRMGEARAVGAVQSPDDVKAAQQIEYAWTRAYTAVKSAILSVGAALLPHKDTIDKLADSFVSAAATVREFVEKNKEIVLVGAAIAAAVVVVAGLAAGFTAVVAAAGLVSAPVLAIAAAVAVVGVAVVALGTQWQSVMEILVGTWNNFKSIFVDGWHEAVRDIKLAWAEVEGLFSSQDAVNAEKARINAEFEAAQKVRDRSRTADLEAITGKNGRTPEGGNWSGGGGGDWGDPPKAKAGSGAPAIIPGQADRIQNLTRSVQLSATRGAFSSGNFSSLLSGGRSGVAMKTLDATEEVAKNTAKLIDLAKAGGLTWG